MIKPALFAVLFFVGSLANANEKIIRVNNYKDPNADYAIAILKLALAHVDSAYKVQISTEDFTQARINEEIRSGGALDLGWAGFNAEMESSVLPIRIPIFKGLLGYRILIINKNDQAKFDQVQTLDDLKKISFGQGRTWASTRIFEANGFNVVKVNKYPGLFHMVEAGRFDAFPRGVHEPFLELEQRPTMALAVEKNLMLVTRYPYYLFVSNENKELAKNIETGLNRAIADGSFDREFFNNPSVKNAIEKADMKNRKIFYLDNPTLSKETPLNRAELWLDPQKLP